MRRQPPENVRHTLRQYDLVQRLKSAALDERRDLIAGYIRAQVSQVIGWATPGTLDGDEPLTSLGLDSLMAVELRNRIQSDVGVAIPVAQLLQGPSVNQLSMAIFDQTTKARSDQPIESARPDQLLARMDQLSEAEVDSLLSELLANEPSAD